MTLTKKDFALFGCTKSMNWNMYVKCNYDVNLLMSKISNEDKAVLKYIISRKNGR